MENEKTTKSEKGMAGSCPSAMNCYTFFEELGNKFLSFFGLMKISRAKTLTRHLHIFYVGSVLDGVERDFKVPRRPGAIEGEKQWWDREFDSIMSRQSDDVTVTTKPQFAEFV